MKSTFKNILTEQIGTAYLIIMKYNDIDRLDEIEDAVYIYSTAKKRDENYIKIFNEYVARTNGKYEIPAINTVKEMQKHELIDDFCEYVTTTDKKIDVEAV